MAVAQQVDGESAGEFGMRELIARLWQRRWWVAASMLAFTLIAAIVAFATTPVYRSAVVVVPASIERNSISGGLASALGQLGGLASLAGIEVGGSAQETEEALAVLKSRRFTEVFINERKLLPKLFHRQWDASRGAWRAGTPPTAAKAYKYFNKRVRNITQDKKTGLVTMQIDWTDAQEAADWANELVQRLNAEMRTRAIDKANASLGYLEKELNLTSTVETREAINRLIEAQIKQRMLANVTTEYAFRVVDKALPADPDDPVKPQKVLLLALGPVAGLGFGIVMVIALGLLGPILPTRRDE
jgi:uncharacterized protein involved in exopolysaccharide biosynthesis